MNAHTNLVSLSGKEKIAPHNAEAERQVLGAILMNNAVFFSVSGFLKPEHFHVAAHQDIYEKCAALIRDGKTASPITLKTFFASDETIAGMTPTLFLLRLAGDGANAINVEDYGQAIHDLAIRREMIDVCQSVIESSYAASIDQPASKIVEDLSERLFDLQVRSSSQNTETTDLSALAARLGDAISARRNGEEAPVPTTGLVDVDADMTGFRPGRLVVLAGRPGSGKTQTMVAFARKTARQGYGTGICSMEIDQEEWFSRLIAAEAALGPGEKLTYSEIQNGTLTDDQTRKFEKYSASAARLPLKIADAGGMSAAQIEAKARAWKREFERDGKTLSVLFVDYLGLMRRSNRYKGNMVAEMGELVWAMKCLAKSLGICVVLLAQLNRQVEARDDKRPHMSDLRDSGNIEEHADQVLLLYRPAYYDARDANPTDDKLLEYEARANDLLIRIGKNRLGPCRDRTVYCAIETGDIASKSQRV